MAWFYSATLAWNSTAVDIRDCRRTFAVTPTRFDELAKRLRKGKRLGEGAFGGAFVRNSLLVWKVSCNDVWKVCLDGYIHYARAVIDGHLTGPYVPRIYLVVLCSDGRYAVLMERMAMTWGMVENGADTSALGLFEPDHAEAEYEDIREGTYNDEDTPYEARGDAGRTAKRIRELLPRFGRDIHGANVMLARCGRMVITDPVASG